MRKVNKVINVSFSGGILGALADSPKNKLERTIKTANEHGWCVRQVMPSASGSFFYGLLRFLVLILTIFLYTFDPGVYIILEKEISEEDYKKKKLEQQKKQEALRDFACGQCGNKLPPETRFCTSCGAKTD